MYTLFIDTHYNEINIILYNNNDVISKKIIANVQSTSVETMPAIISVLKEANLSIDNITKIAVVIGPGSFTGLRIGVTIAKVLAYANKIAIVELKSTDLIGMNLSDDSYVAIEEKNGAFVTYYDGNNNEIVYYKQSEYNAFKMAHDVVDKINIDYVNLIKFINKLPCQNVHNVNPLYVKKIEALDDKRN